MPKTVLCLLIESWMNDWIQHGNARPTCNINYNDTGAWRQKENTPSWHLSCQCHINVDAASWRCRDVICPLGHDDLSNSILLKTVRITGLKHNNNNYATDWSCTDPGMSLICRCVKASKLFFFFLEDKTKTCFKNIHVLYFLQDLQHIFCKISFQEIF